MLDSWIGAPAAEALEAYRDALDAAAEAAGELERVREMGRATGERLDEAAFVLRRNRRGRPRAEGELEELEAQLPRVEHGEALMAAAALARERLSGDDGACDALGEAVRALEDAARYDARLSGWAQTLESSLIDIEDVSAELRDYADEVDFDPEELDRLQTRLAALEGLRRAYGPGMADVLRRRAEAREVVAAASDGGELERRAAEELRRREAALAEAADALDAVRAEAAPRLAAAVSEQMAFLEMGSAGLEVAQERLPRAEWDPPRALPRGVPLSPGCGPHGAPAAAHRVGRRGQPRDAGAQGGARRGGLLRDARLRRGRRRRGRRHGGRARERAGPTRPDAPGRRGHAPRAGGGWRPSGTTSSRSTRVRAACPRPCSRRSRARSGVAEVARMLSGDTGAASRDLAREMLAERAGARR